MINLSRTKCATGGTLAVMAGGEAADIERARPYVLAMARRLTHMGPTGAGQTTKLCNQVIEDGRVVGLISIGDVVKWRVREFEHEQEALRDYIKTA